MMIWRNRVLGLLPFLMAGCMAAPPGPDLPPQGACGAPELQGMVGQDARVLQTLRLAVPLRVIRPGMAVTEDYAPGRLNIELNAADRIQRVYCG